MKKLSLQNCLSIGANVAVVAGIIFLAIELRQNSVLVELEMRSAIASEVISFVDLMIQDESLVELLGKETDDLTQLEADGLRLLGIRLLIIGLASACLPRLSQKKSRLYTGIRQKNWSRNGCGNYAGYSARAKKFQTLLAKEMLTLIAQHPDLQEAQSNAAKASQALEAEREKR